MKILNLSVALSLMLSLTSPVLAQGQNNDGGSVTLKNAAPVSEVIIDGALWSCSGTSCSATTVSGSVPALYACQHTALALGEVLSFTYKGKTLSAERLARCNSVLN